MMSAQNQAPNPDLVRVLLIEDSQDDHRLVCDLLDAASGVRFVIDWAKDLAAGRDLLDHHPFDICLVDCRLPDGDGLDLLEMSAVRGFSVPMIVLTGHGSAQLDRRALALGAHAFLDKDRLDPLLLERTIRYAIQQQAVVQKLKEISLRDDDTGLITPTLFQDRVARALAFADRHGSGVAVMVIDLEIEAKEGLGQVQQDQQLETLAKSLVQHLRKTDTVARLGARQWALIIEGLPHRDCAALVARKVLDRLTSTAERHHQALRPHIGIALYPEDCGDIDSLMRQAEAAMCQAGAEGGGRYRFGSERADQKVRRRFLLADDLKLALDQKAFMLRYVPLLHVADTAISLSAEIYSGSADNEPLSARHFLSVANDRSLIEATTDWILQAAVAQLIAWQQQGIGRVDLALPFVSTRASDLPILERLIRRHVGNAPIAPECIEIDLGQDLVFDDLENGGLGLAALKRTGVRLALDGFGREGGVFRKLNSDLLDSLKLSSRLYHDLPGDGSEETFLKAIINLGHDLDLRVVANGASNEQQFAFLRRAGCDAIKLSGDRSSLTPKAFASWLQKSQLQKASATPKITINPDIANHDADPGHPTMELQPNGSLASLDQH